MSYGRRTALATLATLFSIALCSCGRHSEPTPPAVPATPVTAPDGSATSSAASQPTPATAAASDVAPPAPDGSPQLATESDGVHIEYRVYGSADLAVVLIHGWATDANYWNAQIKPLQANYTVVTVDLAGHGASTRNRHDWSMENYGADVAAAVGKLPNHQLILVGHSMGATVALEATRLIGTRVIGVIAVDALKSVGLPPLPQAEIDKRVAPFRADFIGSVRRYATDELFEKGADPVLVQKVAYDMSLEPPEVAVPSLQALLSMDFKSVLPDIHVPVMSINSDMGITDESRIRKSLPGFKADIIAHTGHFLMMEAPDRFNPVLLRDVDTLARRARH